MFLFGWVIKIVISNFWKLIFWKCVSEFVFGFRNVYFMRSTGLSLWMYFIVVGVCIFEGNWQLIMFVLIHELIGVLFIFLNNRSVPLVYFDLVIVAIALFCNFTNLSYWNAILDMRFQVCVI